MLYAALKYWTLGFALTASGSITIQNAGFEAYESYFASQSPLGNNVYRCEEKNDPTITDWTMYDDTGGNYESWGLGISNPTGGDAYGGGGCPSGFQCGYILIEKKDDGKGEFGIMQTLPGELVAADTSYTLTVSIGNPASNSWAAASQWGAEDQDSTGFPGYRVDLMATDGTVLASDSNSKYISGQLNEGEWAVSTVQYDAQTVDIGKTLKVRLVMLNVCQGTCSGDNSIDFDDFQLIATTTAPTPAPTGYELNYILIIFLKHAHTSQN